MPSHVPLPGRNMTSNKPPLPSPKPVSQLQRTNPRQFQIGQLIKRFAPSQKEISDATVLSFTLNPSDPDFPFELAGLDCNLTIPASFPQNGTPTLRITNAEMARGFQINVEKGFQSLIIESPRKPLLALLNDLDKNLEHFLTAEKAHTIKIVTNTDKKPSLPNVVPQVVQPPSARPEYVAPPVPSWSAQQLSAAKGKRQSDVRQLEARMGRLLGFSKSTDGTRFNIPVHIANAARLPPCTVHLNGVYGSEVEGVQLSFERRAREQLEMTLMAHINHLIQNIHTLAAEASTTSILPPPAPELPRPPVGDASLVGTGRETEESQRVLDPDHPHVMVIPRPPEWDRPGSGSESSSDSYDSEDYTESEDNSDVDDDGLAGGATLPDTSATASSTAPERGILLSFPNLELHGIELLTISFLSLSVKCLRCKTQLDISNIKPSLSSSAKDGRSPSSTSTRTESCPKCCSSFEMTFTPQLLHQHSVRAATIETTGCTIADMLPSTFQPTCSACSTPFPSPPGMISVRGHTPIQVCRSCHSKMTFTIPEVKFLRLSTATHDPQSLPLRKPKRENLGVTTGNPLPSNGTCSHYAHSYRWFRFSCCGRVYPCDRCHDAAESHVNEHAERMLCGWCSREQRFRPEDCGFCTRSVIRRRRGAGAGRFWEGGKGTRERALMSRKDKHKYKNKRAEGSAAAAAKKA
ncbi:uncharacterized protein A1O9_05065 [Exophiala aquamarina CBS 119918]|uniref:CHY-type domain-containing protein n=1 Tax=Exophiala aquamarina CBS 119918 TaxID=1182545 RepID=A0A072PX91_9EURO|nr:uncharacterized protein A1O9_05065 [Exophiala aquamarina CBS 119918]KEF60215.1 hypothetical protein A1O9_05065 [Exophiala aquamarina CBS 119918]